MELRFVRLPEPIAQSESFKFENGIAKWNASLVAEKILTRSKTMQKKNVR